MSYRPYRCGRDCSGGYYCLILIVMYYRKIKRKLFGGKRNK
ncbi:MAG: hypothetical protein QF682_00920 [Candidatus Thermoplasmatota archaeon]|nr:hypothetical protein [Candidatus Thermoplasmatota archaeon]